MIYLDYTSTTPVRKEVLDAFVKTTEEFWGNPSSLHKFGLIADNLLNKAREQMKNLIDGKDYDVLFTSCATEASNLAIKGIVRKHSKRKHIITTGVEHPSVFNPVEELEKEGYRVTCLNVGQDGRVNVEEVKAALTDDTVLVSVMHVNNEIGTVMPIKEIGTLLQKYPKVLFHVDAVQALGKLPVRLWENRIDLLSVSAHKIYGLKGSGALFVRKGIELLPQQLGGEQEFKLRAGTVDVASAVAFAKAMRLSLEELDKHYEYVAKIQKQVRTILEKYDRIVINTPIEHSSPYILNFSLKGIKGETFVHAFDVHEIYFSTKSACSSKIVKPSRVLKAIGRSDELASNSIRLSFSHLTTEEEITEFASVLDEVMNELV